MGLIFADLEAAWKALQKSEGLYEKHEVISGKVYLGEVAEPNWKALEKEGWRELRAILR